MKYILWGVFQYNQIWKEGVVRPLLVFLSIGICILCRLIKNIPLCMQQCHNSNLRIKYMRGISFCSVTLSLVINVKQSRINFIRSVRFLNNWHSLQSLDKITTGIYCLAFSSCFFPGLCHGCSDVRKYCSHLGVQNRSHSYTGTANATQTWREGAVQLHSAEQWSASPSDAVDFAPLICSW